MRAFSNSEVHSSSSNLDNPVSVLLPEGMKVVPLIPSTVR